MSSKVYFASMRIAARDSAPEKLCRLMRAAGLPDMNLERKYVAIKTHFGEMGNTSHLRPAYTRTIAGEVRRLGGRPFATDCSTLYAGMRSNALDHLECAAMNGFNSQSCGCPIVIGDGLRGNDEVILPVPKSDLAESVLDEAVVGRVVVDADVLVTLTHAKGCASTAYGGVIKNIGMGFGSRAGKMAMHSEGAPAVLKDKCIGCGVCIKSCGQDAIVVRDGHACISEKCVGCGHCISYCPCNAIKGIFGPHYDMLQMKMAEYAAAVLAGRDCFHVAIAADITPQCDCFSQSDVPIVPDVGMFASTDPVALDRAIADMICAQPEVTSSALPELHEKCGGSLSHLHVLNPHSDWELALEHAAKLGAGSLEYELVYVE